MILISHRGNTNGIFESWENEPTYVDKAIKDGYDVEIDVWYEKGKPSKYTESGYSPGIIYLGHDKPLYGIDFRWIRDRFPRLWIHCKNVEAVEFFSNCGYPLNYFWHQTDDIALTSLKHIWTYPGKTIHNGAIAVLPELHPGWDISEAGGVCSDYIENYK
jgi:hypothetical protein